MTETNKIVCTACSRSYAWKPELAGKKGRCKCGEVILFPKDNSAAGTLPPESPQTSALDAPADPYDMAPPAPAPRPATIPPTPVDRSCPECHATLAQDAVLCTNCGYDVESTAQPSPAAKLPPIPIVPPAIPRTSYRGAMPGAQSLFYLGVSLLVLGLVLFAYVGHRVHAAAPELALLTEARQQGMLMVVPGGVNDDVAARGRITLQFGGSGVISCVIGLGLALTGGILWSSTRGSYALSAKPHWFIGRLVPMGASAIVGYMVAYSVTIALTTHVESSAWIAQQSALFHDAAEARRAELAVTPQERQARRQAQTNAAYLALAEKLNNDDSAARIVAFRGSDPMLKDAFSTVAALPAPTKQLLLEGLRKIRPAALTDPTLRDRLLSTANMLGALDEMEQFFKEHLPETLDPKSPEAFKEACHTIREHRMDKLTILLDRGLSANARPAEFHDTLLICAIQDGDLDAMAVLFKHKADPNLPLSAGDPPIYVVVKGYLESRNYADAATREARARNLYPILDLLLANGADVNGPWKTDPEHVNDRSPLILAAQAGDIKLIQYLLDKHADPNLRDCRNSTALDNIRVEVNDGDIKKLLLEHGAKP